MNNEFMDKVYEQHFLNRTIFVNSQVTDEMSKQIVAQIMLLDSKSNEPIKIIVNSPGGSVSAGLGIYDAMVGVKSPISTVCVGLDASMGSIILMAAKKGNRYISENSRVLLHQPLIGGVYQGQATDLQIQSRQMVKMRHKLYQIITKHTKKSKQQIEVDCQRDFWLNAQQAIKYGVADKIYKW